MKRPVICHVHGWEGTDGTPCPQCSVRPSITFTVHGKSVPKGSTRAFMPKGGKFPVITSTSGKNLKQWEGTIRGELQVVMAKTDRQVLSDMFDAPVAVGLRFYMPRPKSKKKAVFPTTKPDIDKLARAALDALSTVVFRDDAQVIALQARKVYADAGAKLVITIENWS